MLMVPVYCHLNTLHNWIGMKTILMSGQLSTKYKYAFHFCFGDNNTINARITEEHFDILVLKQMGPAGSFSPLEVVVTDYIKMGHADK